MPLSTLLAVLTVAVAGLALSVQTALNTALGRLLADPVAAAALSFGVGFAVLGQMAGAPALHALGAFGLTAQAIGWRRLAAVALVAAGVALSRA